MQIGIKSSMATSERISGAANSGWTAVEDVGVNRRFGVVVAQELLHHPNIVTAFPQMRRKRLAESMASGSLGQSSPSDRLSHSFVNERFVYAVASLFARPVILPTVFLGKGPRPAPFCRCDGILQRLSAIWSFILPSLET